MVLGTATSKDLQALTALIDSGQIRPVLDRTYPLSEAADVIRHLHTGRAKGKLVITV